jgi:hypothetical protein
MQLFYRRDHGGGRGRLENHVAVANSLEKVTSLCRIIIRL